VGEDEPTSSTIFGIAALSTLIVGLGAASFFLRYFPGSPRWKLLKPMFSKPTYTSGVSALEQAINEIKSPIGTLGILNFLSARTQMMLGEIRDLRGALVPRTEHQARWEMLEEKLNLLESKLHGMRKSQQS